MNTRKKYQYAFDTFFKWTKLHNINPLSSSDFTVSVNLIRISQSAKSATKTNEAIYAIRWANKRSGFYIPCYPDLNTFGNVGTQRKNRTFDH